MGHLNYPFEDFLDGILFGGCYTIWWVHALHSFTWQAVCTNLASSRVWLTGGFLDLVCMMMRSPRGSLLLPLIYKWWAELNHSLGLVFYIVSFLLISRMASLILVTMGNVPTASSSQVGLDFIIINLLQIFYSGLLLLKFFRDLIL